ncbi:hypothetical protein KI809_03690 [Geobacter pelophilus]|uniref:Glycosyltransferase RgtA/B/C/D-like domain-containing protein n=2 Tax=Geoanaerobacter pelophilus TaxID=60036 RepID=A0AAW4L1L8_9BACT|nr:hypothetical protein [Geoanaerobacter pelophilus]
MEDDFARYLDAINGGFFNPKPYGFIPGAIKALNKQLMLVSAQFARLFYVVFFAIPLSLTVYYLNRRYFNFEFSTALFSAILLNILPFQIQIPTFLDGSYPLIGLLFIFTSINAALEYLQSRNPLLLLLACLSWYMGTYHFTLAELNIFMTPSVLILFLIHNKGFTKDRITILTLFSLISSYKIYLVLSVIASGKSRGAATPIAINGQDIIIRIGKFISWSSLIPTRAFTNLYYHSFCTALLLLCSLFTIITILLFNKNLPNRKNYMSAVMFYALFSLCASFPFITASPFIAPRYFFVANVGICILYIMCIYLIVNGLLRSSQYVSTITGVTLLSVTMFAGVHRHMHLSESHAYKNKNFNTLCDQLKVLGNIQPGSQMVVTGFNADTGEHYKWSSGLYSFCLKKPGISGIIGNEYSFYDQFSVADRAYFRKMGGLDVSKPIYLFRSVNNTFIRPKYLLRWLEKEKSSSAWTIYTTDATTNLLKRYGSGEGIENYQKFLKNRGLSSEEILWGGYDPARKWTDFVNTSKVKSF